MTCTAWRLRMPGCLLLLEACSEGSAATVGDHFSPSTSANTVPAVADSYNLPALCGCMTPPLRTKSTFPPPPAYLYQRLTAFFHRNVPHLGDRSDSNRSGGGQHEKI
jgi:hypothetical protein